MSKKSFIKRILSLGRSGDPGEESAGTEEVVGGGVLEATQAGEAALRPSITEILFRRRSAADEDEPEGGTGTETRVLAPDRTAEKRLTRKEETAQKITEGFENLSGILKSINQKLEAGNERSRGLADSIEELPEVLRSIPETNRAQVEFLGTISKQLDLQTVRSGELMEKFQSLPEILRSIPAAQREQAEQLRELMGLLTTSAETQMNSLKAMQKAQGATLTAFQNTQNKSLNAFHKAQQQSLAVFKRSQENQARQMQEFVERTQRSTNRVLIACAAIVSAAVAGVGAMLLLG